MCGERRSEKREVRSEKREARSEKREVRKRNEVGSGMRENLGGKRIVFGRPSRAVIPAKAGIYFDFSFAASASHEQRRIRSNDKMDSGFRRNDDGCGLTRA
ncbi:hypothetical protein FE772_15995 [Lysobacter enzymogenes]|nr:hypothetical protein FE772_15995 [Lysobacter enzymogenes]